MAVKVAGIVRELSADPGSVLDVGCGTGQVLRALAPSLPRATRLVGADPAAAMITAASAAADLAGRARFVLAAAEDLPFRSGSFGIVVSTLSFDHWADQQAGLAECARVLRPDGRLVLADLFAGWR